MPESSDIKRPKNAAPIPFPDRHESMSPPFDEFIGSLPTASPSVYSEFNVVLDDGTLQKRTVSLSTLPDQAKENVDQDMEDEIVDIQEYDIPSQKLRKARYT